MKEGKCPYCGLPKSEWKRRKDWRCCSTKCSEKFWEEQAIVKSWQDLREKCFERDGWRCVKCGKQPTIEHEYYREIGRYVGKVLSSRHEIRKESPTGHEWKVEITTEVDTMIADHIKPIAIGGPEWDINNLQTLCIECNKVKTRKDAADIAKVRRSEKFTANLEKKIADGQKQLM